MMLSRLFPRIIDWIVLHDMTSETSLRLTLVNLIGLSTTIRSITQVIPGCQNTASRMPLAEEGVITS